MAKSSKKPRRKQMKPQDNVIPPGAKRSAFDRAMDPGGGPPGSGAGPRHAAGDPGSEIESTGHLDTTRTEASLPLDEEDTLENGPPYAGIAGGAVGGTPAQKRAVGGRTGHGISPGNPRHGDSTVGSDPDKG